MNPSVKSALRVGAGAIAIFAIGYFVHTPKSNVDVEKEYNRKMDSLRHVYDSLQKKSDSIQAINVAIRLSIDGLQFRNEFLRQQLFNQSQAYNDISQKYKDVKRIDSFGTESIRQYYYNNFDTTKITQ